MTVGIYKITSNKSHKVYVGSSVNVFKRYREHIRKLIARRHHSYKLQKHFIFDSPILTFTLLEECSREDLAHRESYYILLYDSVHDGFNVTYDTRRTNVKNITKKQP